MNDFLESSEKHLLLFLLCWEERDRESERETERGRERQREAELETENSFDRQFEPRRHYIQKLFYEKKF